MLTPSNWTPVLHPFSSVRSQCAERCSQPVLTWLKDLTIAPNIVIMDFVLSELINVIIDKNFKHN